jgi:hypothetical protein
MKDRRQTESLESSFALEVAERAVSAAPGQTPMGHLLNSVRYKDALPSRTVGPDGPKVNVNLVVACRGATAAYDALVGGGWNRRGPALLTSASGQEPTSLPFQAMSAFPKSRRQSP